MTTSNVGTEAAAAVERDGDAVVSFTGGLSSGVFMQGNTNRMGPADVFCARISPEPVLESSGVASGGVNPSSPGQTGLLAGFRIGGSWRKRDVPESLASGGESPEGKTT